MLSLFSGVYICHVCLHVVSCKELTFISAMASSNSSDRLQQLESIEQQIATALQYAGKSDGEHLPELGK